MNLLKSIHSNTYNFYIRKLKSNISNLLFKEIQHFIDIHKNILAAVVLDLTDKNFNAIIHIRSINGNFEYYDSKTNFLNIDETKEWLNNKTDIITNELKHLNIPFDPLPTLYPKEKLHPYFNKLTEDKQLSPAKNLISELLINYKDKDGNFIEQFQTQGFNARLWELYLNMYFKEEGLIIEDKYNIPDFTLINNILSKQVSVEATIISQLNNLTLDEIKKIDSGYINSQSKNNIPLRFSSSIFNKINHIDSNGYHYWEFAHTTNKPFVIAIADFHESFSNTWTQTALSNFLYGSSHLPKYDTSGNLSIDYIPIKGYKKANGTIINSGLFYQEGTENISAIITNPLATLSKFNRIGKQLGLEESHLIMKKNITQYDPTPNSISPKFSVENVSTDSDELWSDGLVIYHNPNAKFPLDKKFFSLATQCFIENGQLVATMFRNQIYSIETISFLLT